MNLLILGDGPEETRWAEHLLRHPEHRLAAACPGFKSLLDVPGGFDLDAALSLAGIDAVIVGGDATLRAEGLRRATSTGMKALALHPPGPNADPYYQVALSRQETGAVVVPDLPIRLHPAIAALLKAMQDARGIGSRQVRYEVSVAETRGDLVLGVLPRVLDVVRDLIGEIQTVSASGVPSGERPTESLTVHLKGEDGRHGEIRIIRSCIEEPARLTVPSSDGSITFEHDLDFTGPSRLVRRSERDGQVVTEIEPWDAKAAILRVLDDADSEFEPGPGLTDGTRAMEIAEAAARSLRRARSIDLHYEEMSEVGNFKSVMTSVGCGLLLGTIAAMFVAVAAHGLGMEWAVYILWAIPPILVGFSLFQLLRYAIKSPKESAS